MPIPLQQLDQARVVVEMNLPDRQLNLVGRGEYETRAEGNRLNVYIDDPDAPFTLVLDEDSWSGEITVEADGAYRVRLSTK